MHQSVAANFLKFTEPFEGFVTWMYADRKGLVTTGLGNLIDRSGTISSEGLNLDWRRSDGTKASQEEIRAAFNAVKNFASQFERGADGFLIGIPGGGSDTQQSLTDIRITRSDVLDLVENKLASIETTLRQRFGSWDVWPADAQLGTFSMSWAMGEHFGYPKFTAAANQLIPDFMTMAEESVIPELKARSEAQKQLFRNAARVLQTGADPSQVYWPNEVVAKTGIGLLGFGLIGAAGYFAYQYAKQKGLL